VKTDATNAAYIMSQTLGPQQHKHFRCHLRLLTVAAQVTLLNSHKSRTQ